MRRFMTLAAAMTIITVLGCKHTAGICDCDSGCSQCGMYGGHIKPEPLPVMPKINGEMKKDAEKAKEEPKEIQLDKELPLGNEK